MTPDCVLIVGTELKAEGFKILVRNVCRTVKSKENAAQGVVIYVNNDQPSFGKAFNSLIDYRVYGCCDKFASLIQADK